MNATDHERIAAARSSQRRKLASWLARQEQTGLAARRLAAEQQFAAGEPLRPSDLYSEDGPDIEPSAWSCEA